MVSQSKMALLTKSNYLLGLQCPKLLWVTKNEKGRIPEPDELTHSRFKEGNVIGVLATKVFENGIDLSELSFKDNLEKTKEALNERTPIFEAGFLADNLFSRGDILFPVGKEWDIIEVKSGTKVKDINIHDVSFQKYVYEKAGLKIRKCFLMHVNNQYVKDGGIEPKEFFVQADITEKVLEFSEGIEKRINNMFKIINSKETPKIDIGQYCKDPYECALKSGCWAFLPQESVFNLYLGGKKSHQLYKDGILKIKDIPEDIKLSERQAIQKECALNKNCKVNKKEIKKFLSSLNYPLYYLDFETINPAIPKFDGMKPYQQIPFQYSLHIQEKKGGKLKHISFLADGTNDPRPKFMQSLKENLGEKGDIIVYNESFEKSRLKECADSFPEFKDWTENNILPRIKDLLIPFRQFHFYDPKQCGSASIKKVLPVMSDLSYEDMEINNGGYASIEYERVTYDENVSDKEKKKVRKDLEKYCELDTQAEAEIIKKLYGVTKDEN